MSGSISLKSLNAAGQDFFNSPVVKGAAAGFKNLASPTWWKNGIVGSFDAFMNVNGAYGTESQKKFIEAQGNQSIELGMKYE
jgi:hypothetical protein